MRKQRLMSLILSAAMLLSTVPVTAESDTVNSRTIDDLEQQMLEAAETEGIELDTSETYTGDVEATQEPYYSEPIVHEEIINHDVQIDEESESLVDRSTLDTGISTFLLSSDDYDELWKGLFSDYFGSDYLSPHKNYSSSQRIEGDTNRLIIEETDLVLPGKNGLDVKIKRKHDNQYYNKILSSMDYGSKMDQSVYFFAAGYTNEDENEDIYVLFYSVDEYYMYMEEGLTVSEMPDYYTYTTVNGERVYCYIFNDVYAKKSDSGIELSRNTSLPDNESFDCEIEQRYTLSDRKLLPRKNTIGHGWELQFPEAYLYRYQHENDTDGYPKTYDGDYIGAFRDINGAVYALEGDGKFKKYEDGTTSYTSSFSARTNEYLTCEVFIQTQTLGTTGIEYNFVITDNRGLTYYFSSPDISEDDVNSRQIMYIVAVKDNFGNIIKYEYNSANCISKITDTYGREINITSTDTANTFQTTISYYDDISGGTKSISYKSETLAASTLNNASPIKGKDVKRFTVTNAENEKTIYDARQTKVINYRTVSNSGNIVKILNLADNAYFETSSNYNIERIIYPSGAQTRYNYKYIYPLNMTANARHGVYSVIDSYDIVNNVEANHKTYTLELDSTSNMVVTTTNSASGLITIDEYNDEGLLEISTSSSTGGKVEPYTRIKNTYDDYGNIETQIVNNSGISNTTEYTYNINYPGSIESITTDKQLTEYTYHVVNGKKTDIPKTTTISYMSDSNYVEDYMVETTLNSKNAIEYTRQIQDDEIKSQMKYSYDGQGRVNSTTQWTANSVNDGVLDTNDEYVQDTVWNIDSAYKTLYYETYLPDITDADGNTDGYMNEVYKFNIYGYPYEHSDGNGNTTQIEYDDLSRPVKYIYANDAVATIAYNTAQSYTIVTDASGTQYKYIYDGLGKIKKKQVYDNGWKNMEEYTYDTAGRVSSIKKYRNSFDYTKENYTYDVLDRVTLKTVYDGEVKLYDEAYTYTTNSSQLTVTKTVTATDNTAAAIEKSYYDKYGNLIKTEAVSGDTTITNQYTYDYKGNVLTKTEPNGQVWTYEYDLNNNVTLEHNDSLSKYNMYAYDLAGRMKISYDQYSGFSYYTYDEANRVIQTRTPFDGAAQQRVKTYYDANSNVIKEMVSTNPTSDTSNITYSTTEHIYDEMNNRIGTITENGTADEAVQYWYDDANRVIAMANGLDSVTENASIPTSGSVFRYEYNTLGYPSKTTDALGNSETYTTDLVGNVTNKTDRMGIMTVNEYGPYGILTSTVYNTSEEEDYYYTYDKLGRVKKIQLLEGMSLLDYVDYTYDAFGRVTQESNDGAVHAFGYDANSNVTQYTMAKNGTIKTNIANTYSTDNLLTSQTINDTIVSYQYNGNRNMTKKTIGDYVTDITYNKVGLPKTYVSKYGTMTYNDYSYTYRTDGNRISEYDSIYNVTKAYTYDGVGRLTNEAVTGSINKTSAYTYDKRGNRIGETVTGTENHTYVNTYDNNNRLLTSLEDMGDDTYEGTAYVYDKNGNQLQKNFAVAYEGEVAALYGEIFTYTVTNKLKTYRNNNGNKTATYTYKATGMRDTKTVAGVTTGYIWNGNNMVAETNSSGVIQNQYHYGVDGLTMAQLGTSTKIYLKDAHGNVVGTSDMGGLQDSYYIYDAFGNDLESLPNESNPFGYCGEYLDDESGLIYLRNRYYDTTTGRFVSEDPIRDGLNWYSYCGGNPVMFVDPLGLIPSPEEAAEMADHIYGNYDMSPEGIEERTINGWRLISVWEGRESMKMGIYIPADDDWQRPSEYVVAFAGTTWYNPVDWLNNVEQAISSKSADTWDAINYAKGFVADKSNIEVTFVGHSKGGAEAASAAVATNRNAILFNPADTNLSSYGLDGSQYYGEMTQYVVTGEILSITTVDITVGNIINFNRKLGPVSTNQIPKIQTIPLNGESFFGPIGLHGMGKVKEALN